MTSPRKSFGAMVRRHRLAKKLSLRKFAEMVGVSPTYLSLVEQGKVERPPTAERVRKMAELLGENPDQWTALAGRMPDDVAEIIREAPETMPALLRAAKGMTVEELKKLTEKIERQNQKDHRS
ncbi:MAG: helix-turn-helix domain-containing protein [Phycisphaerales bacterium]|nr:helix-turn-helix domain-containing protein [Phycisphaerales bacterium]